ncbi:hypothetical protein [Pseudomonas prosekii]|nr:hypothetical protein [Pseudomonas prosekii]
MKAWTATAIALATALGCGEAMAATDYRCTVERTDSTSKSSVGHVFIGKQFTVERRTGVMAGALKNSYVTAPQVIDPGSTENSFKVMTTMQLDQGLGSGSALYALVVNEYQDGPRKNFVFLDGSDVYFGWCEHF